MSSWKEDANHRRDVRAGIVEQVGVRQRSKKDKLFIVEFRWAVRTVHESKRNWLKYGAYRSLEEAEWVIELQGSKFGGGAFEFRLRPDAAA